MAQALCTLTPPPLVVGCTSEDAYRTIHDLLLRTPSVSQQCWSFSKVRKSSTIFGTIAIDDIVWDSYSGRPKRAATIELSLLVHVHANAEGKTTVVDLEYIVERFGSESEIEAAIQLTTQQITAALKSKTTTRTPSILLFPFRN